METGETITASKYCQQLDEMHRKLFENQRALVNRNSTVLVHDNASPLCGKNNTKDVILIKHEDVLQYLFCLVSEFGLKIMEQPNIWYIY